MSKPVKQCMSLSTLFLIVLAIYVAVSLLCFQTLESPHSSLLRGLLAPFHSRSNQPALHPAAHSQQSFDEPSPPSPAARALQHPAAEQQQQTDAPPDEPTASLTPVSALNPPPSIQQPTPLTVTPTPRKRALPAAGTPYTAPPNTYTKSNDLPAASSFVPPLPTAPCAPHTATQPWLRYTLHHEAVDSAELGVALNVTVYRACAVASADEAGVGDGSGAEYGVGGVHVDFRVHVTGVALAAVQGVLWLGGDVWHASGLLRLPDAGGYTLACRLQAYNASADMVAHDWPYKIPLQYGDIPGQTYPDRDVAGSPVAGVVVPPSSWARHRPLDHGALQSTPPTGQPLPLCWTHPSSPSLAGRWVLGPRRAERLVHPWPSTSVFDEYAAVYAPYDCALDYTAAWGDALAALRWVHVVGDSNMRALFIRLCEAAGGVMHSGSAALGGWDLPRLCTVPRDVRGDGVMVDNATVITYTNWFWVKKLALDADMTFAGDCARYTEDTKQIEALGLNYGWPECQHVHSGVYQMHQPSLTYFGWGNHQAELGASDTTRRYMRDTLYSHPYWRSRHALVAYTEDTDPSRMAGTYKEPQFVFRNNPRVQAVNEIMREAVVEQVGQGKWKDGEQVEVEGGGTVKPWLPIFDAFSVTHAASEGTHGDCVHFWPDLEVELVKLVAHYATHAPQLHAVKEMLRSSVPI